MNALGGVSGLCGFVNDEEKVQEISLNLKFASSLETIKHAENSMKKAKASLKREKHYAAARKKLKLKKTDKMFKCHAEKLTVNQMQAVAFVECGGARLKGRAADMREQLVALLPSELGIPDYETQDMIPLDESGSDDEDPDALLGLPDLEVGDTVEVYWQGELQWFKGEITNVDHHDSTFEVFYTDGNTVWHKASDYSVRRVL